MTPAQAAIAAGLSPRQLEHFLSEHASVEKIAEIHELSVYVVRRVMWEWGLGQWKGREKSGVVLVVRNREG